jgi:hypothetical protein
VLAEYLEQALEREQGGGVHPGDLLEVEEDAANRRVRPVLDLRPHPLQELVRRAGRITVPRRPVSGRNGRPYPYAGAASEPRAAYPASLRTTAAAAARPCKTQSGSPTPRYAAPATTRPGHSATAASAAATRPRCPTV